MTRLFGTYGAMTTVLSRYTKRSAEGAAKDFHHVHNTRKGHNYHHHLRLDIFLGQSRFLRAVRHRMYFYITRVLNANIGHGRCPCFHPIDYGSFDPFASFKKRYEYGNFKYIYIYILFYRLNTNVYYIIRMSVIYNYTKLCYRRNWPSMYKYIHFYVRSHRSRNDQIFRVSFHFCNNFSRI